MTEHTDLKTAQKLKALGMPQVSEMWWVDFNNRIIILEEKFCWSSREEFNISGRVVKKICAAPSLTELLEFLPEMIEKDNEQYYLFGTDGFKRFFYEAETGYSSWEILAEMKAPTPLEAAAKIVV